MHNVFLVMQLILALLITISVLLQSQGSGLGATFGGGGESYHTRRGLEKVLFYFTIVAIGLFLIISLASIAS